MQTEKVKSYSLNPPTTPLAESTVFDSPELEDHAADFEKERIEMESETCGTNLLAFVKVVPGQPPFTVSKIHLGSLGAVAGVHTVRTRSMTALAQVWPKPRAWVSALEVLKRGRRWRDSAMWHRFGGHRSLGFLELAQRNIPLEHLRTIKFALLSTSRSRGAGV